MEKKRELVGRNDGKGGGKAKTTNLSVRLSQLQGLYETRELLWRRGVGPADEQRSTVLLQQRVDLSLFRQSLNRNYNVLDRLELAARDLQSTREGVALVGSLGVRRERQGALEREVVDGSEGGGGKLAGGRHGSCYGGSEGVGEDTGPVLLDGGIPHSLMARL
jgi:hypothetical protein